MSCQDAYPEPRAVMLESAGRRDTQEVAQGSCFLCTVLLVAFLEKPFIKLKYYLLCFITNSDEVSRQWVLGEAGADFLRSWKSHSWVYVRHGRAAGSWCAVYYLCSLTQGWWCLALGTISVASIKTFPSFARLWPEATLLCTCSPSWLWMGLGLNRGHRFWKNVLQRFNEPHRRSAPLGHRALTQPGARAI